MTALRARKDCQLSQIIHLEFQENKTVLLGYEVSFHLQSVAKCLVE